MKELVLVIICYGHSAWYIYIHPLSHDDKSDAICLIFNRLCPLYGAHLLDQHNPLADLPKLQALRRPPAISDHE